MKETLRGLPVIGTALRMQERYVDDAADNFAASIGFFGFVSLFPLIIIALSVFGFVVRDDIALQTRVVDAISRSVPGLSSALGDDGLAGIVDGIGRNAGSLLSVGTATLLFSGLKVVGGAQRALAIVFRMEVPTGVKARLQQLLALALLGTLVLVGSALGGSVGVDLGAPRALVMSIGLTALAFAVDLAMFLTAYRFLSPDPGAPPWKQLLPGSILAAAVWVALKAGGSSLLVAQGDNDVYGSLAGAVGLLLLLYLAGRVFMYGAELSALLGDMSEDEQEDESVEEPLVSPRPVPDERPAPIDLAKLTGAAAVLGFVAKAVQKR